MNFFPDPAIFVTVGNLSITWYALMTLAGVIAGFVFLRKGMIAHGYTISTCEDLLVLCLLGGIVVGRIGWILENFKQYSLYVLGVISLHDGGFEIICVLLGCGLAVYPYTKRKRMSFFRTMDVIAPTVFLVSIIAKVGRCFAYPHTWIVEILNITGFMILQFVYKPYHAGHKRGDITAITLLWMGAVKLIAFVFHLDSMAVNCLWACILAEAGGFVLYMRNRKYKAVKPVILFDLDGTLMDSKGMVLTCFKWMYRKYGNIEDFTKEKQLEVFGPPLRDELAKLFPNEDPDKLVHDYHTFQSTLPGRGAVDLMPGVNETLTALKEDGYVLGIVSSRLSESCNTWLKDLQIADKFDVVLGRDQFAKAKPAPDGILKACEILKTGHDSCIYVGDSPSDVMSGRNAGVFTVGIVSNTDRIEAIRNALPNYQITGIAELLPMLKEDHCWTYEKI